MNRLIHTAIIGGGQAGLAMSFHLKQRGIEHIVLERSRVAEGWRTERWDSLVFQFPNWSIKLPGHAYTTGNPDGFAPKDEIVTFLEGYADAIQAPLQCGVNAQTLQHDTATGHFVIGTSIGYIRALNIVSATGSYHQPVVPPFSQTIPKGILQIHSRDYRNPAQLPPGNVLVVGSGASGVQIAEELHNSGKHVYLSVGRHDWAPRRYRQRDIYWWLDTLGIWRQPIETHPEMKTWRPLYTGVGGGHDINLHQFARDGMTLVGRLQGVSDSKLHFAADLMENLLKSEIWFASFKTRIDEHAREHGFDPTLDEEPDLPQLTELAQASELDMSASNITAIIWAGGFKYDFSWIKLPVFDTSGEPMMRRGVSNWPSLYFLGLRRTYTVGSSLLAGVGDDAGHIAQHIATISRS